MTVITVLSAAALMMACNSKSTETTAAAAETTKAETTAAETTKAETTAAPTTAAETTAAEEENNEVSLYTITTDPTKFEEVDPTYVCEDGDVASRYDYVGENPGKYVPYFQIVYVDGIDAYDIFEQTADNSDYDSMEANANVNVSFFEDPVYSCVGYLPVQGDEDVDAIISQCMFNNYDGAYILQAVLYNDVDDDTFQTMNDAFEELINDIHIDKIPSSK